MKKELTAIDLYCGAGGFSEGFIKAGVKVLRGYDIWVRARDTFEYNHSCVKVVEGDIIELSKLPNKEFHSVFPNSDIIIGSPPCVSFSNSNTSGYVSKTLGIELIKAFLRIVVRKKINRGSQLKYWILENVPKAEAFIESEYKYSDLGVNSRKGTLKVKSDNTFTYSAIAFGVPTKRKRYFCGDFPNPITNHVDYNELTLGNLIAQLSVKDPIDPNWKGLGPFKRSEITDHDYTFEIARWQWDKAKRQKEDKGYMGKMSFPDKLNEPCRTITAFNSYSSRESIILSNVSSNSYRSPTTREFATAMSFPIDYRFTGRSTYDKIKQIGNSVPPRMAYGFAVAILKEEGLRPKKIGIRSRLKHKDHERYCFTNLNGKTFDLIKENEKKIDAIFTHHIPYLKIRQWRVELTNVSNGISVGKPRFNTRLAYSQGNIQARVYTPRISSIALKNIKLNNAELDRIQYLSKKVVSHKSLQINYTKTLNDRKKNKIFGPFEVLKELKELINSNDDDREISFKFDRRDISVPYKIALGYKMLKVFLNNLN